MPDVATMMDILRGRLVRLKSGHTLRQLADAMEIDVGTLKGFLAGRNSTLQTMQAIERWCDTQEAVKE